MRNVVSRFAVGFTFLLALAPASYAQAIADNRPKAGDDNATAVQTATAPMKEFRKVGIGMSADDVESAWGDPKVKDESGFLFNLSDSETAQVELGPEKKVTAIAITFKDGKGAPSLAEVFGAGATADRQANGTLYKMVRYKDAGYWISYYEASGDNAATTVTIRKL
jgi:hypothetical protein